MAEATFMQHTYMLSFQKTSLATDHCFNFRFFGCNPPTQFVRSPLLATLAKKNTLGEVDKINLIYENWLIKLLSFTYDCQIMIDKTPFIHYDW